MISNSRTVLEREKKERESKTYGGEVEILVFPENELHGPSLSWPFSTSQSGGGVEGFSGSTLFAS